MLIYVYINTQIITIWLPIFNGKINCSFFVNKFTLIDNVILMEALLNFSTNILLVTSIMFHYLLMFFYWLSCLPQDETFIANVVSIKDISLFFQSSLLINFSNDTIIKCVGYSTLSWPSIFIVFMVFFSRILIPLFS